MTRRPDPAVGATPPAGTALDDPHHGATLVLAGRLDALRALPLRAELDELVVQAATHERRVLVDLSEVDFVDSAALAALVRLRRQCLDAGVDLALVRPRHPDAQRIFRLTQFDEVFVMLESRPR